MCSSRSWQVRDNTPAPPTPRTSSRQTCKTTSPKQPSTNKHTTHTPTQKKPNPPHATQIQSPSSKIDRSINKIINPPPQTKTQASNSGIKRARRTVHRETERGPTTTAAATTTTKSKSIHPSVPPNAPPCPAPFQNKPKLKKQKSNANNYPPFRTLHYIHPPQTEHRPGQTREGREGKARQGEPNPPKTPSQLFSPEPPSSHPRPPPSSNTPSSPELTTTTSSQTTYPTAPTPQARRTEHPQDQSRPKPKA